MVDGLEGVGPEVLAQLMPETPRMLHEPVPVGAKPPVAPETVAVKVKVSPKDAVGVEVVTTTVGVLFAIIKVNGVLGPAEV